MSNWKLRLSAVCAAFLAVVSNNAAGQLCRCEEEQKLRVSDTADLKKLGRSVSIDGDTVFIGAPGDDTLGSHAGAVYVFRRVGGTWVEEQKLTASDGIASDWFGESVAVDGDVALIGAWRVVDAGDDAGAAYIFRRINGTWTEQQKLIAAGINTGDEFGSSVSLSGDVALIGAHWSGSYGINSGSAHVFRHVGGAWVEEQELIITDGASRDYIGTSVSVEGDVALVGAPGADHGGASSGAAHVFRFNGSTWVEEQKLTASDAIAGAELGLSVSVSGDVAIVGAPRDNGGRYRSGSAYFFRFNGITWLEEQKVVATHQGNHFGRSVSISEDVALVGIPYANLKGLAKVFRFNGDKWVEMQKYKPSDLVAWDVFGDVVAVNGRVAVVGTGFADDPNNWSGAAYAFKVPELALDIRPKVVNHNGQLKLTTCGGPEGQPAVLYIVDWTGTPMFTPLALGMYNRKGRVVVYTPVPPGLAGTEITLQSFGINTRGGMVVESNRELLTIQ